VLTFAVTNTQALWYLDRGTGLVSIILLTIVVALGIAQRHGIAGPSGQRFVVTQIHRNAALLSVAFLAIHIASSVIDGFAPITWLDAIIPFASPYRTLWLGLGALAFDLILALIATSLLRQRIGYSAWRSIHWFAYLAWPIAFVHGLGTGTDGREGLVQLVSLVCLGIVVVAVLWRITREWPHDRLVRSLSAVVTVFAVAAIGIWAWNGPMKTGWPRKAGTPASLLATNDGTASSPDTTVASPAPFVPPFTAVEHHPGSECDRDPRWNDLRCSFGPDEHHHHRSRRVGRRSIDAVERRVHWSGRSTDEVHRNDLLVARDLDHGVDERRRYCIHCAIRYPVRY
jgi:sulfoxide reductase heme-binding subunit YedZ